MKTTLILIAMFFAIAQSQYLMEGTYIFTCKGNGKNLDIEGGVPNNGANVILFQDNGQQGNQRFVVDYVAGQYVTLVAEGSGKAITVGGNKVGDTYTQQEIKMSGATDAQLFKPYFNKDGTLSLINKNGLAITCPDTLTTPSNNKFAVQGDRKCTDIEKFTYKVMNPPVPTL